MKKFSPKFQKFLPLLFTLTLIIGMWIGYQVSAEIPTFSNLFLSKKNTPLDETLHLIHNKYVVPVNTDSITQNLATQLIQQLDPFSAYIQPDQFSQVQEELDGKFEGIGIEFTFLKDTPTILKVLPEGPAQKAGLRVGDKLLVANDSSLVSSKSSLKDIKKFIKGPQGSPVTIKLKRQNQTLSFQVVRNIVPIKSLSVAHLINPSLAYIKLDKFIAQSHKEFVHALQNLQTQSPFSSLIIDLRDNGGGLLDAAIQIADELLSGDKLIVYTKGAHTKTKEYKCKRKGLFEQGKLFVLINQNAASASEVLAGALQDWDRALIIGTKSFGKGLVQEQFSLQNGAAIRLTIAKYYTPSGRCIQKSFSHNYTGLNNLNQVIDTFKTFNGNTILSNDGLSPNILIKDPNLDTSLWVNKNKYALFSYTTIRAK